jgi:hypothetical protein
MSSAIGRGEKRSSPRSSRKADRDAMRALAQALEVSLRRFGRDACGDWNLRGRRGHFSTDGQTFYVYLKLPSPRRWEFAKRKLHFLFVTQDGDEEGIFKLKQLPTTVQAVVMRKVLGFRKAPTLTEQQRQAIGRRLNSHNFIRDGLDDFSDRDAAAS